MNTKDHSFFQVKVQTRACKTEIERLGPKEFRIKITTPPVKGAANREVIKLLARYLDVPPSSLEIVKGKTSTQKMIAISPPIP
ncbi:MAG: DUF167 domain-containing protein [Candidatus Aminicenantaceae bacterium]